MRKIGFSVVGLMFAGSCFLVSSSLAKVPCAFPPCSGDGAPPYPSQCEKEKDKDACAIAYCNDESDPKRHADRQKEPYCKWLAKKELKASVQAVGEALSSTKASAGPQNGSGNDSASHPGVDEAGETKHVDPSHLDDESKPRATKNGVQRITD